MAEIIEIDKKGALTIPPELLDDRHAGARYLVERSGSALHIRPLGTREGSTPTHEERMRRWRQHAADVASASTDVKSVVEALIEMRR